MSVTPLANDCFATDQPDDGGPMAIDQVLARLSPRLQPVVAAETVALDDALDRILADAVMAACDVPPHDNAAVDGFAVHFEDLAPDAPTRLPVFGRLPAGAVLEEPQPRGTAIRIFTGAPMPAGPDTVVMQEDCHLEDGHVVIPSGVAQGSNRRRAGEDVRSGTTLLSPGRRLAPPDLGLAASVGLTSLSVRRPLHVAVFSTGNEIADPGTSRGPGMIYDANRFTVKALLRRLGCVVTDHGILPDDRVVTAGALLDAAERYDAIVTSGGVSAGEEDHVRQAIAEEGRIDAWRLAVKPGRPIALGVLRGKAMIGLPGNPVAATVAFIMLARPVLLQIAGAEVVPPARFPVTAGFDQRKKPGRREFLRVRLTDVGQSGALPVAVLAGPGGSGVLSSLAQADGLLDLTEASKGLAEGDTVDYLPFSEVM